MRTYLSISAIAVICLFGVWMGLAAMLPSSRQALETPLLPQENTETSIFLPGVLASYSGPASCDPHYPVDFFRACYFRGADPTHGVYLGSLDEPRLPAPVANRAWGINHDWGREPVFAGITPGAGGAQNDISGVWRGRLRFQGGRYQFTAFSWDGVRLYIDEKLLIDEWQAQDYWYRFGAVFELSPGYHNIRVEWWATGLTPQSTLLRLHWDRVPVPANRKVSPIVIDVFLLKRQDTCIVGSPWVDGEPLIVYNQDGSAFRRWQIEDDRGLPRTLPPTDPGLNGYGLVECFSFGLTPLEIASAKAEVDGFARLIENWSGGDIAPTIRLFELAGQVDLGRIGSAWWIPPGAIAPLAAPSITRESDFVMVLSSTRDPQTGRSFMGAGCGNAHGPEFWQENIGGTGYSWVPCIESLILLHEWEHQWSGVMQHLLGFQSRYPDVTRYPPTGYPACGAGDADIFSWFPDSEEWGTEPDSPWCGSTDADPVGIAELHLFAHFDASLAHYPIGFLTGNHCRNGIQDFGEYGIDRGSNCPVVAGEILGPNLVQNGSFENGTGSPQARPDHWTTASSDPSTTFTWDGSQAYAGGKSARISAGTPVDAHWSQVVPVQPNTFYRLSGYIKTENIAHSPQANDLGATLSILGTWDLHTPGILGTANWQYVSVIFHSGDRSEITIGARLGFWSGVTTGTAWFDDIRLTTIAAP